LTQISFDVDALREAAAVKAGYDDFGSDSYLAALGPLVESIKNEAELNERGLAEMHKRIAAALANRLVVVAWEKDHPLEAAKPIEAPVVILGMPRTGSTILHETMAAIPGMRAPLTWEITDFSLVHRVDDARDDDRVQRIDADIARDNDLVPGYTAIHYSDAYVPMECVALTIVDLVSVQFPSIAGLPTYREFLLSLDARSTYEWHRRALVFLQASRPGMQWVLKAPAHSLYIDALFATYPDARVVYTHRDPRKVVGSVCSLYATLRRPWSDIPRVAELAASDAHYTAAACMRAIQYRDQHPDISARIRDVAFDQFMRDQAGTMTDIYDHLGLNLTDEARGAMVDYLTNRPREKYGTHDYSLAQFGLTDDDLTAMFAPYISRYRDLI
jgi:hypothetical protein